MGGRGGAAPAPKPIPDSTPTPVPARGPESAVLQDLRRMTPAQARLRLDEAAPTLQDRRDLAKELGLRGVFAMPMSELTKALIRNTAR
jgi:hypothetical protein